MRLADVLDRDLRVAFDFNGILADDEAEVIQQKDPSFFYEHETRLALVQHNPFKDIGADALSVALV